MFQLVYDFLKELEERINGVFHISLRTGDRYLQIVINWKEGCFISRRIDIIDISCSNLDDKFHMDLLVNEINNEYKKYLLKGEKNEQNKV